MTRAAPANLRNGLKWRDGRPRWEPSPAARALDLKGRDLKDEAGNWMDRGAAIGAADRRALWTSYLLDAAKAGDKAQAARAALQRALDALPPADEVNDRHARHLVADLIEAARALLEKRERDLRVSLAHRPHLVSAMLAAYFVDVDAGKVEITAGTRMVYWSQRNRILDKWGHMTAGEVTRPKIIAWYKDQLLVEFSIATANLTIGALGSMFAWASRQDPPWVAASPVIKIGMKKAPGRRVFWTFEEEAHFNTWCDANQFEDVADMVTMLLWTGARQVDGVKTDLEVLARPTWRYVPQKTQKGGREALAGLLQPIKDRAERRRRAAAADRINYLGGAPFSWDVKRGRRHSSKSIGVRFREAQVLYLASEGALQSFAGKRLQDTRDTCVTRLWEALDGNIGLICSWTGHSPKEAEEVLRDHYLVLRDQGALETAEKLKHYAIKAGVAL